MSAFCRVASVMHPRQKALFYAAHSAVMIRSGTEQRRFQAFSVSVTTGPIGTDLLPASEFVSTMVSKMSVRYRTWT